MEYSVVIHKAEEGGIRDQGARSVLTKRVEVVASDSCGR